MYFMQFSFPERIFSWLRNNEIYNPDFEREEKGKNVSRERERERGRTMFSSSSLIYHVDFPLLPMEASPNRQDKYLCLFSSFLALSLSLSRITYSPLFLPPFSSSRRHARAHICTCTPPHVPGITAATANCSGLKYMRLRPARELLIQATKSECTRIHIEASESKVVNWDHN